MPDNTSAFHLLLTGDPALFSIVGLSLAVSLIAVIVASFIGMPLGALVALTRFRGREFVIVMMNAFMGLPQGHRGIGGLPQPLAVGAIGLMGIALYAFSHGDCADDTCDAHLRGAHAPNY
jgi:tungstate transport system permease protein